MHDRHICQRAQQSTNFRHPNHSLRPKKTFPNATLFKMPKKDLYRGFKELLEGFIRRIFGLEVVMQRNFGRNSGFKPVSSETEIKECFDRNYLNFRALILPLLSSERAARTDKLRSFKLFLKPKQLLQLFGENGSK